MPNKILLKRSATANTTPAPGTGATQVQAGELAINTADGRLFTNVGGTVVNLGVSSIAGQAIAPSSVSTTGDINAATGSGFRINNTATAGNYLRGDGTRFVANTIQSADLGSGTANSSAFLRGDRTWQTLNASAVGLGNVANTAQVTAVSGTAPIVSSGGTTPAISISAATTSAAGSMSAADKSKLDGIAANAQVNVVTSVAGKTGAVSLVKGDVGLGAVDNLSASSLFNNNGDGHTTRTAFGTTPSYGFGFRFVAGAVNGPGVNGATQYYSLYTGLGSDYPATGTGSYGMQIAIPRNTTVPYFTVRYNENNAWGGWQKISAGYADSAGAVAWSNVSSKPTTLSGFGITDAAPSSHVGATGNAHGVATTSVNGFMASTDKSKLDGIAANAQVNVATNLAQGTRTTTSVPITSSTGSAATLDVATTSLAGVMSSADKSKLDGIAAGANNYSLPATVFRNDATNSGDLRFAAGDGRGLRFWDSDSFKIWMSSSANATWGGRLDTTSDYNMYFRFGSGGTNRGFVFKTDSGNVFQIEQSGALRTAGTSLTASGAFGLVATGNNIVTATTNGTERVRITGAGNVGIGNDNPASRLVVKGSGTTSAENALNVTDSANTSLLSVRNDGLTSLTGQLTNTRANSATTGAGQIYLNGATGNRIDFNSNGSNGPTTTTRSVGTKICLAPTLSGSAVDCAIGVWNNNFWCSAPTTTQAFWWFHGTTLTASLTGGTNSTLTAKNIVADAGNVTLAGQVTSDFGSLAKIQFDNVHEPFGAGEGAVGVLSEIDVGTSTSPSEGTLTFGASTENMAGLASMRYSVAVRSHGLLIRPNSLDTSATWAGGDVNLALDVAGNSKVTGDITARGYLETTSAPTISSGTLTLNLNNSRTFLVSLNANITTLTISNVPSASSTVVSFTVIFTADGTARTITWPGSVKWPAGTAPTLTSTNAKKDVFSFVSTDAGTTWLGVIGGQNY
jgi:hypothetical protein